MIPHDALLELVAEHAKGNFWRLQQQDEAELTTAPVDGFRAQYLMTKRVIRTRDGTFAEGRVVLCAFPPEQEVWGEPVEEALAADSQLMSTIASQSIVRKPAIVLWVYPDSYGSHRLIKDDLQKKGYVVATRIKSDGTPVVFAFDGRGTRSYAQ